MRNPATGMLLDWNGNLPPQDQPAAAALLSARIRAPSKLWPAGRMPENGYELIAARRTGIEVYVYQDITGLAYANSYPFVTYGPSPTAGKKTPITDILGNVLSSEPIPGWR